MGVDGVVPVKISAESAAAEWKKFLDFYEVDLGSFKGDMLLAVEASHDRACRGVSAGRVEVNLKGGSLEIVQHLKNPLGAVASLVWREPTAADKIALDKAGEGNYSRLLSMTASLTGVDVAGLTALKGVDASLAEAIAMSFLQI